MTSAFSPTRSRSADRSADESFDPGTEIRKPEEAISRLEWVLAAVVFAALLGLRIRYNLAARYNSDEPQHLHVVWAWATGLLQYKDVFDNHMPLFQLLMAPIFRLFGERADIVVRMRFVMLPLFAVGLWTLYRLGSVAFSQRAGVFAALLAAAWPRFFLKMGEFRTDVLWTVFWLLALLVAVSGPVTWRRSLAAGLLLGAALGVSMKTLLLLAALALSLAGIALFARRALLLGDWRSISECLASGLAGVAVVPALLVAYFCFRGAWNEMLYCVWNHNILPSVGPHPAWVFPGSALWGRIHHHLFLIIGGAGVTILTARLIFRTVSSPAIALRRMFLLFATVSYLILLFGFWPMVTPQDLLPADAGCALCFAPALLWIGDFLTRKYSCAAFRFLAFLAVGAEIAFMLVDTSRLDDYLLFKHVDLLEDSTSRKVNMVADVLRLTDPGQKIMDGKGETIFRPRASYIVLETIMNRRLRLGLRKDTLVEDMIAARAPLIHDPDLMPPADLAWVKQNYVPVGDLEVLGKLLPNPQDGVVSFDVVVPETYLIVADHGMFEGTLDGVDFTGPRFVAAGRHEIRRAASNRPQKLVLFWARAGLLGYSPRFFLLPE